MTTDAKHVENLAGLPEVKSLLSEWSTAAESAMSRRGVGVVSCLGSSELADRQDYEAEKDITVPVRERHTRVVSSCSSCKSSGGDLHGPGSSPSHDEQVRSAD